VHPACSFVGRVVHILCTRIRARGHPGVVSTIFRVARRSCASIMRRDGSATVQQRFPIFTGLHKRARDAIAPVGAGAGADVEAAAFGPSAVSAVPDQATNSTGRLMASSDGGRLIATNIYNGNRTISYLELGSMKRRM